MQAQWDTTMGIRIMLLALFVVLLVVGGMYVWTFEGRLGIATDDRSFEECVKAGNRNVECFPRQRRTNDGRMVVEKFNNFFVPVQPPAESNFGGMCKPMCGDGVCQEIVCMGSGCPCVETVESCPVDCQ